jgi:hypothetical protein
MKNQALSLFVLLCSFSAAAQKVTATVDRQQILIGEQIKLRLQANFGREEQFLWFDNTDTIPRFEILDKSAVDTSEMEGGYAVSQIFILTSWDSGKIQLPAFVMSKWKTKPIPINVAWSPHPFDTTKPYHDIKDILEVKLPVENTWYWYLIFALVVIGLFLLFFPQSKEKSEGNVCTRRGRL